MPTLIRGLYLDYFVKYRQKREHIDGAYRFLYLCYQILVIAEHVMTIQG